MSDRYIFLVEGLDDLGFEYTKDEIEIAAMRAINATADHARSSAADEMKKRLAYPASYLQGSANRLSVTQRASRTNHQAIVSGRDRPTSLARFGAKKVPGGVRVEVKRGKSSTIKNAFLMPLRNGNMGLAVRTKRGQRPRKAYKPVKVSDRLWLLYGPSVDQVFKQVREEVSPESSEYMEREFLRLLKGKF